jgi:predicted DNA-binding transcriptional regulator YafY
MKNAGARHVVERIIAVLQEVAKGRGAVNQCSIARRMECSAKTIQRDFEFIRDRLMLPLEYHPLEKSWRLASDADARRIEAIGFVFANLQ